MGHSCSASSEAEKFNARSIRPAAGSRIDRNSLGRQGTFMQVLLALSPEQLGALAFPIAVVVFIVVVVIQLLRKKSRQEIRDAHSAGRNARAKHPIAARVVDMTGVVLVIVTGLVWFFFYR